MKKAFTILELAITVGLISLLVMVLVIVINPIELKSRSRDERKLSDISAFDALVTGYKIDYNAYPETTPPDGVTYSHTENTYELNVVLEYYTDKSQNDGGDDSAVYEIRNDLTII